MRRFAPLLSMLALLAAAVAAIGTTAGAAKPRGINGKLVVNSFNPALGRDDVYTVDPDGTNLRLLATNMGAGQWSPDGTRIAVGGEDGVHLVNPDDGSYVNLPLPALYPDLFLPCSVWSPDGSRLACEGFGETPGLTGVYTVRSSDGGGLQEVTSGGDNCPGDYSPNGKRLVFLDASGNVVGGQALFTVKVDGTGLRRITPPGLSLDFDCGNWSPQGNEIVFSATAAKGERSSIWTVHSDGSGLRQLPTDSCGGAASSSTSRDCHQPVWSPNGKKIAFSRFDPTSGQTDIYTAKADGSGLFRVTNTPGIDEEAADWGTHPVSP